MLLKHSAAYTHTSIDAIYAEAWEKTNGMKNIFWKAFAGIALTIFITINLSFTLGNIFSTTTIPTPFALKILIQFSINALLVTPLCVGLFMICVKQCTIGHAPINTLFEYLPYWKRLAIIPLSLMIFILLETMFASFVGIKIGIFFLFVLLIINYFFYIPLCVDKKFTVLHSLDIARKMVFENRMTVSRFVITLLVITFFSLCTGGIAFIWTLPWMGNAIAIFYRELFGIQIALV